MKKTRKWAIKTLKEDYRINNPTEREINWMIERFINPSINCQKILKDNQSNYNQAGQWKGKE